MSDFLEQHQPPAPLKREHDSTDDFEHLEHELQHNNQQPLPPHQNLLDLSNPLGDFGEQQPHNLIDGLPDHHSATTDLLDTSVPASNSVESDLKPVPATPPPSADFDKFEGGARHQAEVASFGTGQQKDELEARIRQQLQDPKVATMAFMETEKSPYGFAKDFEVRSEESNSFDIKQPIISNDDDDMFGLQRDAADNDSADEDDNTEPERSEPSEPILRAPAPAPVADAAKKADRNLLDDDDDIIAREEFGSLKERDQPPSSLYTFDKDDFMGEIKSSTLPEPEKSPELDFVKDEIIVHEATKEKPKKPEDELWNVLEKSGNDRFEEREVLRDEPPTKPLPPLPKGAEHDIFDDFEKDKGHDKYEMSNDFLLAESKNNKAQLSGGETGDSEFESEPEPSPAKTAPARPALGDAAERKIFCQKPDKNRDIDEIAPKEIWRHIGIGELRLRFGVFCFC